MDVNKLLKFLKNAALSLYISLSTFIFISGCAPTDTPLHEWHYTRGVFDAALSAYGDNALMAPTNDKVQYWDTNAPRAKFTFIHQKNTDDDPITNVAIAKQAQIGLTACPGQLAVWDLSSGKNLRFLTLPEAEYQILTLEISTHGKYALIGFSSSKALLIDLLNGQIIKQFTLADGVRTVAFSTDGTYVLIGSDDTSIRLWDLNTGEMIHQWFGTGNIQTVAFSDDGSLILASTSYGDAIIYDRKTGKQLSTLISDYGIKFAKGANGVSCAKFTQNNQYVITGAPPRSIRVFDVASGKMVKELNMPKSTFWLSNPAFILSLTLSEKQDKIIALSSNGNGYEYLLNLNQAIKK